MRKPPRVSSSETGNGPLRSPQASSEADAYCLLLPSEQLPTVVSSTRPTEEGEGAGKPGEVSVRSTVQPLLGRRFSDDKGARAGRSIFRPIHELNRGAKLFR